MENDLVVLLSVVKQFERRFIMRAAGLSLRCEGKNALFIDPENPGILSAKS
jgi:hypothetical protein